MITYMQKHKERTALFITLFALQLADALTTMYMVSKTSFDIESNPLMHMLLVSTGSSYSLLIVKALTMMLLVAVINHIRKGLLYAVNILMGVVVFNNFYYILTM